MAPTPRSRRASSPDASLDEPEEVAADRAGAPVRSARSALPTPEFERLFTAFREDARRLRDQVYAAEHPTIGGEPESEASENLRVVRAVFGKWSIDILAYLVAIPSARFSDLRRRLRGISADVLSRKLYALERSGLIERRVGDGRPPAVEYRLTEDGLTLTRLGEPVLLFLRLRTPANSGDGGGVPRRRPRPSGPPT
jgi:DNA-binding HxlR family transcriptional regulator